MTKYAKEKRYLEELKDVFTKAGGAKFTYGSLGATGLLRFNWGKNDTIPVYVVQKEGKSIVLGIQNYTGIGDNCIKPDNVKSTPGFTHYFEHCMFHNVTMADGTVLDNQGVFDYGSEHGLAVNACTNSVSICTTVGFTPIEGYDMMTDGIFKNYLNVFKTEQKDVTEQAIDLINSITFKHEIKEDSMDKEKGIVCSEINMYHGDDQFWLSNVISNATSAYYDELGTVESVQSITYDDMINFDKLFKAGDALCCMIIQMDIFEYSPEYIVNLSKLFRDKVTEIVGEEKMAKTDKWFTYKQLINAPSTNPRKEVVVTPNGMTKQPMLVITVPKHTDPSVYEDTNRIIKSDTKRYHRIESLAQTILYVGLSRPITQIREKYGRTYTVQTVRHLPKTDPEQNKLGDCIGWAMMYNADAKSEVVDPTAPKFVITKEALETMKSEIADIMNNISVSEDEFKTWKKEYMDMQIKMHQRNVPLTHFIPGLESGIIDVGAIGYAMERGVNDITYDIFTDYINYIKENWIATLYADVAE